VRQKAAGICLGILFFVLGIVIFFQDNSYAENETGIVTASLLNVRTGAGTSYDILQNNGSSVQLKSGTEVTILSTSGSWYQVSFSYENTTLKGYVSSQYIAKAVSATPTPTTASATASPTTEVTYRSVTTYQNISVPAKTRKKVKVYSAAAGKVLVIAKTKVSLAAKQAVTIIGEKTVDGKKWFRISFDWNKKTKKGYVRNIYVKMTLKSMPYAVVRSAVTVRTKAKADAAALKQSKKNVKLAKNAEAEIAKDTITNGVKWYQVQFSYNGKTLKGYVRASTVKLAKKKVVKKEAVTALSDKEFEKMLTSEGFPDSYKQSLRVLHASYPYWQFKAYKTGVDWSTALKAESKIGVNLISNSKSKAWKSTEEGAYDSSTGKWKVFDGSTWVAASEAAVAYYMDPRNFLNERNIFQFELLEYQSQYQTKDGVNSILSNTPFYGKSFSYTDTTSGSKASMKYATVFMKAAKISGVSPYHLASRVKQEVVTSATTTSIAVTGTNSQYPGIYNFYNIGASSGSNPAVNGLKWASKGDTYLRPWTDPYRSIVGGAQYIGSSYINKGQNTGYLQKFNVTSYQRYDHQYMTNVEAAYSEAIKTRQAYSSTMDKTPIVFSIPVYENMPASQCAAPK
jgi:beta-N-acetylglucosaminidase